MEAFLFWILGVLSVFGDVSLVVKTIGGTVCVEVCLAWGCRALSASDDVSLVSTTGCCTESVMLDASTMATRG